MNAATRIAGRLCLNRGHIPLGIRNGFSGLCRDEVHELTWQEMATWQVKGGSDLGTNRHHPRPLDPSTIPLEEVTGLIDLGVIAYQLQKHRIDALLIIGGFEAFTGILEINIANLTLSRGRKVYPAFCIPIVTLPATVSNNVPGTEYSIGSDTALNSIVECCDRIKLSANASRNRVFVVEVQGGNCGYLAVVGGLACGATACYTPEVGINISILQRDIAHLCQRYNDEKKKGIPHEGRLILRTENASPEAYSTTVVSNILKEEGKGTFDSRTAVFGHLQQGGIPSPLDRIRATRLAVACIDWIQDVVAQDLKPPGNWKQNVYTDLPEHSSVIGIRGANVVFTSTEELVCGTDLINRRDKESWWSGIERITRILAKYGSEDL